MKNLVDPQTKQSTAFYFLLGIAGWDVLQRGFNKWNAAAMLALAVPGLITVLARLVSAGNGKDDPPPSVA